MRISPISSSLSIAAILLSAFIAFFPSLVHREDRAGDPVRRDPPPGEEAPGEERAEGAARGGDGFPHLAATNPQEVRAVLRWCESANSSSVPALREAALSQDPLVAGVAIRTLARLSAVSAGEAASLLDDPRPRVRQEAVLSMGTSGDPDAVEHLARVVQGEDPALRALALRALGDLGGERARAIVEDRLRDPRATEVEKAFASAAIRTMRARSAF